MAAALWAIVVCWGWWRPGVLWLTDWVGAPSSAPSIEFPSGPALQAAAGVLWWAGPTVAAWLLPMLTVFACGALWWAATRELTWWARAVGGIVWVANPFVLDRLHTGQIGVLASYALVPPTMRALQAATRPDDGPLDGLAGANGHGDTPTGAHASLGQLVRCWSPFAVWATAGTAITVHHFWVVAMAAATFAVFGARAQLRDRVAGAALALVPAALVAFAAALVSGQALGGPDGWAAGGVDANLAGFAPESRGTLGLGLTLASLSGFWRQMNSDPVAAAPVWFAACVAAAWSLAVWGWRQSQQDHGRFGAHAAVGALGLTFAAGAAGPLAGLYRAMAAHLPGFAVMRESQKFLPLVAWFLAAGLAAAADRGMRADQARGPVGYVDAAVVAVVVVAWAQVLVPALAGGLGGRVEPADLPASWDRVRTELADAGDGSVLMLPWGAYMNPGNTGGRAVTHPGAVLVPDGAAVIGCDIGIPGVEVNGCDHPDRLERLAHQLEAHIAGDSPAGAPTSGLADGLRASGIGEVVLLGPVGPGLDDLPDGFTRVPVGAGVVLLTIEP